MLSDISWGVGGRGERKGVTWGVGLGYVRWGTYGDGHLCEGTLRRGYVGARVGWMGYMGGTLGLGGTWGCVCRGVGVLGGCVGWGTWGCIVGYVGAGIWMIKRGRQALFLLQFFRKIRKQVRAKETGKR